MSQSDQQSASGSIGKKISIHSVAHSQCVCARALAPSDRLHAYLMLRMRVRLCVHITTNNHAHWNCINTWLLSFVVEIEPGVQCTMADNGRWWRTVTMESEETIIFHPDIKEILIYRYRDFAINIVNVGKSRENQVALIFFRHQRRRVVRHSSEAETSQRQRLCLCHCS